jgi:maltose alpha-D-glucosyltransferase/alpha-amylase
MDAARQRGIRVLLDLVAGHTSNEYPWFAASANDPTDDRYIWAPTLVDGNVRSPGSRPGKYLQNYYKIQPALNFAFARRGGSGSTHISWVCPGIPLNPHFRFER